MTKRKGEALIRRVTDGVAVGGLSMPVWWPSLERVSEVAADLVPILSAVWLAVQIAGYARKRWMQ